MESRSALGSDTPYGVVVRGSRAAKKRSAKDGRTTVHALSGDRTAAGKHAAGQTIVRCEMHSGNAVNTITQLLLIAEAQAVSPLMYLHGLCRLISTRAVVR